MNAYNMKKLIASLLCICLTSCVVEYTPSGYFATGGYSRSVFYSPPPVRHYNHSYSARLAPNITPVGHGFSSSPQYVCGQVFRGGDGMLYAVEH
jgi:hypothetical protein